MDTLTPSIGHNNPPPYDADVLAELLGRTDKFICASTAIRQKHPQITTEEQARLLTDHINGLSGLSKQINEARIAAKKPHDEAAQTVQDAFNPLIKRIKEAVDSMLRMQTAYINLKTEIARKQKEAERAAAAAAREEADRLAKEAADSGDFDAEFDAKQKMVEAEKLANQAAKEVKINVASATGAGRTISSVTVREAKITNIRLLFLHYHDRPEVADLLVRLANADIRAKGVDESLIPGIDIIETVKAR